MKTLALIAMVVLGATIGVYVVRKVLQIAGELIKLLKRK